MALPDRAQKRRVRSDCFLPVFSFPLHKSKPIVGLLFSVLSSPLKNLVEVKTN